MILQHILSLQLCLLQLEKSEHAQAYHLLNVFAYRTLAEYNGRSPARMSSYIKSCSSRRSQNSRDADTDRLPSFCSEQGEPPGHQ